ncbi:hypothetical protein GCM10009601_14590 [Streptomyces thermospinosisporus]|uniref:Uncharacterized protein n=1 Tax=Streptomyces thermospinosisporus TaxID=161482 RepID=A0ABP4JFH0_9ACTN
MGKTTFSSRGPKSHPARIRNHVAAGDLHRAAARAMRALGPDNRSSIGLWGAVLDELRDLTGRQRRALIRAVADRFGSAGDVLEERGRILALCCRLAEGAGDDALAPLAAERRRALDDLARLRLTSDIERLHVLVETELAEGRAPAPAVVAVIRRSALHPACGEEVRRLATRLTEPVLNVGEEWAEQALRDATGPAWRALLTHITTAASARPTTRWDRQARALVDTLGAEHVRETVLPWLTLVGRPRTLPLKPRVWEPDINHAYDPCNATALRGLAGLLSLLPPHPGTVRALGALAETSLEPVTGIGPRSPKVATAAVHALTRTEGDPAHTELTRLAAVVTHKTTARLVHRALQARATAL